MNRKEKYNAFNQFNPTPYPVRPQILPEKEPEKETATIDEEWVNTNTIDGWKRIARYWKLQYERKKMDYDNEHQRFIALQGMFEEYENEFNGLIRKKNVDVEKLKLQEILSDYAAHKDIQDIVRDQKQKPWVRISWEIVALFALILFIWQVSVNANFRLFLSQNMIGIAIVAICAFGVFLVLRQQRKAGKK